MRPSERSRGNAAPERKMARVARIVVPGMAFHVVQRGNHREGVFFGQRDREIFLAILQEYAERYMLRILAYCLMGNHYHLICVPDRETSMASAIGRANADYSRWVNIQRCQNGQLWQGRYRSCILDEPHLWNALRYVEQNPVRAGLVVHAWDWPWSSAAAHTGAGASKLSLYDDAWKAKYDAAHWREVLKRGVDEAAFAERLRQATERGRPFGEPEFVENIEHRLGRPVRPQRRGPKVKKLSAVSLS